MTRKDPALTQIKDLRSWETETEENKSNANKRMYLQPVLEHAKTDRTRTAKTESKRSCCLIRCSVIIG